MTRPSGKTRALITGGSSGFGLAMARELVRRGYEVIVCGRNAETLAEAVRETPELTGLRADVTWPEDRARLIAAGFEGGRNLEFLINNAAINRAHDYTSDFTLGADRAREEIEINFAAPIELIRLYLAERRRGGHDGEPGAIVNIGTPGALFPLEAIPLYSSTKAGLHMFTQTLRENLQATPVQVLEVFPPSLDTGLAPDLDVASQASMGAEVIAQVAAETVDGIVAGDDVILPHKQSRALYGAVPHPDPVFVQKGNAGVRRKTGWDQRVG
ncbi:MAG: short-chain dehydrogenase [Phenylobacterium sp.]|nr:short-chain dehydrogenase [Phenylobacterium sp.]